MTRTRIRVFLSFVCIVCIGQTGIQVRAQAPTEPLRTAADRPIDIHHIRLELAVDLPKKTVDGKAILDVRTLRPLHSFDLDAVDFEVKDVTVKGHDGAKPIRFSHDGKKLTIEAEHEWPIDTELQLVVAYRVHDPKAGLHFFAPSEAEPEVPLTVWSQGESITNRYWFPCLDQPAQKQSTELIVTVAEGFDVLSNGALLEKRSNPDKTVTFHWSEKDPHVSYLVTLVVGKFDIVEEKLNNLPVMYYVPKGRKDDVARNFGRTRDMIDFFSRRFGVNYPWEKYAQVVAEQFGGGMENTSATTMGDILLDERALLDNSPDWIIAHELAHQWWGDMLTCRDWAHLWLNEGFASYCEALWAEKSKGGDDYAYNMYQKSRTAIAGGKDRPIVDRRYPSPDSMFDARAYPKGAFVLHMLRQRLGEDAFWKGIQAYGTANKFKSVETSDFRRALEKSSGRSLERFFYDWTERPGHPVLDVTTEYQPDNKLARVSVKQTQASEAFQFPLTIVLSGKDWQGSPVTLEQLITDKEQTFFVPLPGRPDLVEVDPKQAVLSELTEHKGRDLWLEQLRRGGTIVSRIRAAQHLGKESSNREVLVGALPIEKYYGVQVEIANSLAASGGDISRDALIAGLKLDEPKARRACADGLGKFHRDAKAAKALKEVLDKGDKSYYVVSAALTSFAKLEQPYTVQVMLPWLAKPSYQEVLRSAALQGLGTARDLSALDTLILWTKRGKPRTCRAAAVRSLAELMRHANPTEEQRKQTVAAVTACLDNEGPRLRGAAVEALRDVGRSGEPAASTLEAIARHDPDQRLRESAQKVVDSIRNNTPAPVEVMRLRQELERLRKSQETLQERFEKFQKSH